MIHRHSQTLAYLNNAVSGENGEHRGRVSFASNRTLTVGPNSFKNIVQAVPARPALPPRQTRSNRR